MSAAGEVRRIAIVGTGLIGASFGRAVAQARPGVSLVAHDRPEVLRKLRESGLGWETQPDLHAAVGGADLVYLALPVGAVMEMLPRILTQCDSRTLVTDTGSTKVRICATAQKHVGADRKFLGGHPIAGRERSGPEHAEASLFCGKRYALVGGAAAEQNDPRVRSFTELLREIGAEPVWIDAETHDWAMAVLSQMPQLVAIALAGVISEETDKSGLLFSLAGSGLRDLLRTAGSPYHMWRDICMTNAENIAGALDRASRALDFLRGHLTSRELEKEFRGANELYRTLQGTSGSRACEEPGRQALGKAGADG